MAIALITANGAVFFTLGKSSSLRAAPQMREGRPTLGLGLSGGGSRAAAFHRGTTQGLNEVGLLDQLDTVSSVSGGSIFAAAWMSAIWQGLEFSNFLYLIGQELAAGFIARSINWRALKLALPSYTRTNLLAETFDRTLIGGMQLQHLPERPLLCINTSVMNTGQVGKFSRYGFSSTGLFAPGQAQEQSNPTIPLAEFPVALAATASAAFPIGLLLFICSDGNTSPTVGVGLFSLITPDLPLLMAAFLRTSASRLS